MPKLWDHLEAIGRDQVGADAAWSIELSELVETLRARGYHFGSVEFLVDDILRLGKKASWVVDYDDAHKRLSFEPQAE